MFFPHDVVLYGKLGMIELMLVLPLSVTFCDVVYGYKISLVYRIHGIGDIETWYEGR